MLIWRFVVTKIIYDLLNNSLLQVIMISRAISPVRRNVRLVHNYCVIVALRWSLRIARHVVAVYVGTEIK